tara:strand:- start:3492 stop:4241 length:750 start_codon:yes stop_codon:yes gene_type:complete
MKQRYFIEISYKGKNYHGWQVQANAISVQEVLNDCLTKLLSEKIHVVGAGRTDTGVHAKQLFAHFDSVKKVKDVSQFLSRLNSFLPKDIAAKSLLEVGEEVHARFDANARTYEYFVAQQKNPFEEDSAYLVYKPLNLEAMNQAAKRLFEFQDFTSFSKSDTQTKTNNCKIMQAYWEEREGLLVFTIRADRFLRNMVRAIVGTLIEVGLGKMTEDGFVKVIKSKNRSEAGTSVPAHALYLLEVTYPKDIL